MKDVKNILEELRATVADNPTSAIQGVKLEEIKVQQLHPSQEQLKQLEDEDVQDFFFLITQVGENTCEVIPGSMDGVMAGPDDIVLPKNILGQYVYLSLDMKTTVPKSALSDGFAILEEECYQRVLASCKEFDGEAAGEIPAYSRAMPYISAHDDRIEYHKKQQQLIENMQKYYGKLRVLNFSEILKFKHLKKVAGLLLVGLLATLFFFYEDAPDTQAPIIATGTMRGAETGSIAVYSPQQAISSTRPKIAIGGDANSLYTVIIKDSENNTVAENDLSGDSVTHWEDFCNAGKSLSDDEVYTIAIKTKSESETKVLCTHIFWLLGKSEQVNLQNQLSKLDKTVEIGVLGGAAKAAFTKEGMVVLSAAEIFKKAQILYDNECYSDAYIEITDLLKTDNENKQYQDFQKKCLEKLSVKN